MVFWNRMIFYVPVHIPIKFGINILKMNCFIAFILQNFHRGQFVVRTLNTQLCATSMNKCHPL